MTPTKGPSPTNWIESAIKSGTPPPQAARTMNGWKRWSGTRSSAWPSTTGTCEPGLPTNSTPTKHRPHCNSARRQPPATSPGPQVGTISSARPAQEPTTAGPGTSDRGHHCSGYSIRRDLSTTTTDVTSAAQARSELEQQRANALSAKIHRLTILVILQWVALTAVMLVLMTR